jgi:large subunit ribosomal protein L4
MADTKAQVKVRGAAGGVTTRDVDLAAYGEAVRPRLLKDAVVRYLANQRQGTHSTKTRAETSYSESKPWPQKHTGRARAGDKNSPLWRHGGRIFGPKPREYRMGMPVRARREALRSALLGKFRDGEVALVEALKLDAPSTKTAALCLKELGATRGATVVLPAGDATLYRSFRNVARVECVPATELNALHVLQRRALVFVGDALAAVEQRLANAAKVAKPAKPPKVAGSHA